MKNDQVDYGSNYESMKSLFESTRKTRPVAMIAQAIKTGTRVLEFGCASGSLTRYLTEEKNCSVCAIEIDEEAAAGATQWAEKLMVGDCESIDWVSELAPAKFDYILFADVLEHLVEPGKILS